MARESLDPILKPLMASPKLDQYIEQLQHARKEENERRLQFYSEITEEHKAEFINGQAIYHSPVKLRHSSAGQNLFQLLSTWVSKHNLGLVGYEKLMVELVRNSYEPDITFWKSDKADLFTPDQMIFPAPDFIVEVLSPSTEKNDRGIKYEDYAAHSVHEYWIVDPAKEFVEQYILEENKYDLKQKLTTGVIESTVINQFKIPVRSIFEKQEHINTLQQMLSAQ